MYVYNKKIQNNQENVIPCFLTIPNITSFLKFCSKMFSSVFATCSYSLKNRLNSAEQFEYKCIYIFCFSHMHYFPQTLKEI